MRTAFLSFALALLSGLVCLPGYAQKKKLEQEDALVSQIFGSNDPDFDATEIPEKWEGESAVVLCQRYLFDYDRLSSRKINFKERMRRRVKLLDKAAVEAFSEFYYTGDGVAGIRITKPDGTEIEVDRSQAIEVEEEVPSIFRSYNRKITYKKIAIPSLEIGDIIDYFHQSEENLFAAYTYAFDPIILNLPLEYPVLKQKFDFTVDKGFYINFNSYNGAPELKEKPLADTERKDAKHLKTYHFSDENREKEDNLRWHYPYRSTPTIKFQVVYWSNDGNSADSKYFLGKAGEPLTKVDKAQLVAKMKDRIAPSYYHGTAIVSYLNKHSFSDPKEIVEESYYYARLMAASNDFDYFEFANALGYALREKEIPFEVVAGVPKTIGTLNELLLRDELTLGIKARTGNDSIYLFYDGISANPGDIDYYVEGMGIYSFPISTKGGRQKETTVGEPREEVLPMSSHNDNLSLTFTELSFGEAMDTLVIKRKHTFKGHARHGEWRNTLIPQVDFWDAEAEKFEISGGYYGKKRQAEEDRKKEASKNELAQKRLEAMKRSVGSELGVKIGSYDSFELEQTGRYANEPDVVYSETFTTGELVQKAGNNYILEVGKLIGGQVEIMEKERDREYDIYMPYPRSFKTIISIQLPDGFAAEGLESLDMNVDNETGTFKSTAELKDGRISINASKVYKNDYEPKENWGKMIDFLEAAYQFTQQKIVLKKQ